jgi:putative transposase
VELLGISRSGFYYAPAGEGEINLALMRLIDQQFLQTPFYGSRQMSGIWAGSAIVLAVIMSAG